MATIKLTGLDTSSGKTKTAGDNDVVDLQGSLTLGNNADDAVVFNAEIESDFIPDATEAYSLGTPSKKWKNIYAGMFYGDGSNLTNVQAQLTIAGNDGNILYKNGTNVSAAPQMYYKNGNVGIGDFGTVNPSYLVSVKGNYGGGQTPAIFEMTDFSFPPNMILQRRSGNSQSFSSVVDGDILGQIVFQGWNATANQAQAAGAIRGVVDGIPAQSAADMPGELQFFTTANGSNSLTQQMTIRNDGKVGMGIADPLHKLDVYGDFRSHEIFVEHYAPTIHIDTTSTFPSSGQVLGQIYSKDQASLRFAAFGNWGTSSKPTSAQIWTTPANSTAEFLTMTVAKSDTYLNSDTTRVSNTLNVSGSSLFSGQATFQQYVSITSASGLYVQNGPIETLSLSTSGFYANGTARSLDQKFLNISYDANADDHITQFLRNRKFQVFNQTNNKQPFLVDSSISAEGLVSIGEPSSGGGSGFHYYHSDTGLYLEGVGTGSAITKETAIATFINTSTASYQANIDILGGAGMIWNSGTGSYYNTPGTVCNFMRFFSKYRGASSNSSYVGDPRTGVPIQLGKITGNGSGGITYHTSFTGQHGSIIDKADNLELGMILSSTGLMWHGDTMDTALPKVAVSAKAKDKAVFGVLFTLEGGHEGFVRLSPPKDHEQHIEVNSIGEGRILVTNVGGNVENGDYITSSDIFGLGMKQDDDLLHSYTVAKCTESVDWDAITETVEHNGQVYKKCLVACTYHCG